MLDPKKLRNDFPMFRNKIQMQNKPLVFLDNASTTFKPDCVLNAIKDYYEFETSNSHRGDYDIGYKVDVLIDETRKDVAKLINADMNEVVFTSGATHSINQIALGYAKKILLKGDEIILTKAEHASNLLPWFKVAEETGATLKYIPLDKEGRILPENLKKVISNKSKVVALAQVSNVLGFIADIKVIAKIAHEYGAIMVCDGAQSVPHMKVDVKELDVDFLSFSGHKMCGPTGVGVLYGKFNLLKDMDPLILGGGMNATFKSSGEMELLPPPTRFEAGTLNIEGILGLKAAVNYILNIGLDNIREYEESLRKYAIGKLSKLDNVIIYNKNAEAGIISFNVKGTFAQDEATFLNYKGIAVRSGLHCAKILPEWLNEFATVRVSIYFYTTKEDIDYLVDTLEKGGGFLDAYFA